MIVKNGPQFSGGLSTLGLILSLFFTLFSILYFVSFFDEDIEFAQIFWFAPLGLGLSIHLMLAFEGLEFDFKNKQFRKFRQFLFWRIGDWKDLKKYRYIILVKAPVHPDSRNVHFFEVYMKKTLKDDGFMLEERDNYFKAREALYYYSDVLKLEPTDVYAEAVEKNKRYRK